LTNEQVEKNLETWRRLGEEHEAKYLASDVYEMLAAKTRVYPEESRLSYVTLGLAGEAGEVAEKVKKIIRDNNGEVSEEKRKEVLKELSDVFWYLSDLCDYFGSDMGSVMYMNVDKLYSRMERKALKGSGDNR